MLQLKTRQFHNREIFHDSIQRLSTDPNQQRKKMRIGIILQVSCLTEDRNISPLRIYPIWEEHIATNKAASKISIIQNEHTDGNVSLNIELHPSLVVLK